MQIIKFVNFLGLCANTVACENSCLHRKFRNETLPQIDFLSTVFFSPTLIVSNNSSFLLYFFVHTVSLKVLADLEGYEMLNDSPSRGKKNFSS